MGCCKNLLFLLFSAVFIIMLMSVQAQTSPSYFNCYASCPSNASAVGCEIYINYVLAVDLGVNTNFTYYSYINDSANNYFEELICYYNGTNISLTGGGPVIIPPVAPPVPPPNPLPNPNPQVQPPAGAGAGPGPGPQPPAPGAGVVTTPAPTGSLQPGTSSGSGKYFTCTKDCPAPQPGYMLIGCTITINYAVHHDEGRWVPSGSGTNGYVYIASRTDVKDYETVHDEILCCDYWKIGVELPPSFEELAEQEAEKITDEELEKIRKDSLGWKIEEAASAYNEQITNVPGFVKNYLGSENLHLYLTNEETMEFAAATEEGFVTEMGNWFDEDENGNYDLWDEQGKKATMAVYLDQGTLEELSKAEDPVAAFTDAWGHEIRYEGITFGTWFKELFMDIGMWFTGVFS